MSIEYDKYYGVDFAIDFYLEMIKVWKTKRPGIIGKDNLALVVNPIILSRLLLSAWSSQIAITNELSLDIEDTIEGKRIDSLIEKQLDESNLLKRITPKVPLTKKEIKQQLKNALSHAEYVLTTREDGTTIIEISSPKIEGTFTVSEIAEITNIYVSNYALIDNKDDNYNIWPLLTLSTNNKTVLQNAIEAVSSDKEEQEIIRDYILYSGLQNWINLPTYTKSKIFSERILRIITKRPTYRSTAEQLALLFDYATYHGKGKLSIDDFYKMSFEAPSIYTDMLIDLGFLCLNYIKEAQAKQELPNFNYHNINLKGVKYSGKDVVRIVSVSEQQTKLANQIADLTPAKEKAKKTVEKCEEELEKLDQNTKIPPQIKAQQYQSRKDSILRNTEKYNELKTKIASLQTAHDNAEDYVETNNFFRHLRNSISHGFYSIDYRKGLKEKDLGKIVFHFEDFDIDQTDRSKKTKVFEVDIDASRLTSIFETLRDRLVENADTIAQQQDNRFIVLDQRIEATKNKTYVKKVEDEITSRGGIIINTQEN